VDTITLSNGTKPIYVFNKYMLPSSFPILLKTSINFINGKMFEQTPQTYHYSHLSPSSFIEQHILYPGSSPYQNDLDKYGSGLFNLV